jgi:HEPN domain-containing protein
MERKAIKHFVNAQNKLKEAKQELFRPEEDIVSYLVCKNSQHAIEDYLKGYLVKNGVQTENLTTIENLFDQCVSINPNFKKVDLSDFQCKGHDVDSRFCNEIPIVTKCFDAADNLDTFLRKEKII